jgi:hypothetical protein
VCNKSRAQRVAVGAWAPHSYLDAVTEARLALCTATATAAERKGGWVVVGWGRFSESHSGLLVVCHLSKSQGQDPRLLPLLHRLDLPVRFLFLDLIRQDNP